MKIISCYFPGKTGKIRWSNNWVAFMDNILQMQILQEDTRGLYVPTAVEKLTIDTKKHGSLIQELKAKTEAEAEVEPGNIKVFPCVTILVQCDIFLFVR